MADYDVFNGDADGICALQQMRLQQPREAVLVSGLKRDIDLLSRIEAGTGDRVTVLDISLDKNREALQQLLDAGVRVFYADHHYAGEIPQSDLLDCHIDLAADTCTSLIVNRYLDGCQARWAVVGAYGDNFDGSASELGRELGLENAALDEMRRLGICLNYNGYGFDLDDLLFHPIELYQKLRPYADPLEFIAGDAAYAELRTQYEDDMIRAADTVPEYLSDAGAVILLPNESWARRIVGVMGNDLARQFPDRAHALLVDMGDGHHRVSVRAPYNTLSGADDLCRQFDSGGGRKAAAGVNALPKALLRKFIAAFDTQFGIEA